MCGFVHVDSRYGHVSISYLGNSVQFGIGWVIGQKMSLRRFPMYWAYLIFSVCVICVFDMPLAF